MIYATVTGDEDAAAEFRKAGSRVRQRVIKAVMDQGEELRHHIINEELSGQMLKVRRGRLRLHLLKKLYVRDLTVRVVVEPKNDSPLWPLGTGMAEKKIFVGRVRDRSANVYQRVRKYSVDRKTGKVRKRTNQRLVSRGFRGGYERKHHLNKVPFMEAAFASYRDGMRAAIEYAVMAGMQDTKGWTYESGEGI